MDISLSTAHIGLTTAAGVFFMTGQGLYTLLAGARPAYNFFGLDVPKGEKPATPWVLSKGSRDVWVGLFILGCALAGEHTAARIGTMLGFIPGWIDAYCVYTYGGSQSGFSGKFFNHFFGGLVFLVLGWLNIGF